MQKYWNRLLLLIGIGAALITISIIARSNSGKDRIPWREDLTAAERESVATHKPIFLYFTASWCGPCQELKTSTWADGAVGSALAAYVPVKVDLDAHPDLASKYGVVSIPMFVTLDRLQAPVKVSEGYLGPEDFLSWLRAAS